MFEKFLGPKTEEQKERALAGKVSKEFELGVNGPAIHNAFRIAQEENAENNYGFTNNYLLNMVKDCALAYSYGDEIELIMGGHEEVIKEINIEIDNLRKNLSEDEQRS